MDKKIRLLQVIPRLDVGGAETGCKDIAQFISNQNYFSEFYVQVENKLKILTKLKLKFLGFQFKAKIHL